jgi:hypothetical protein
MAAREIQLKNRPLALEASGGAEQKIERGQ